uniref:Integrase catalytic domain-containing protein n=1 Tax=Panagrolaimus sp. PS1159 TaxID=55785 RepID=A0AC35F7R6_9BILA
EQMNETITTLVALWDTTSLQNHEQRREFEIDTKTSYSKFKLVVAEKLLQKSSEDITVSDLKETEKFLIHQEQQIFTTEKDVKEFKLVKDEDQLYRINCRFDHSELINPHPIFLPKHSPLVKLIVQNIHEKLHHAGTPHTLSKPFQNVGIDYCGPFKIKGTKEKAWICLFTCFTTRLVHLEPVTSMTTQDFLFAFRRFVARRNVPYYVLSDNAKQFKTAATALEEIWKKCIRDKQMTNYCKDNGIIWDFITERAPWKGGLYERMVGIVKNALKQSIGQRFIDFVEFWTFLCEVEATINSRPLTYVHSKEPFVIRPVDFISPGIHVELPVVTAENEIEDPSYFPTTLGGGEKLLEHYKRTSLYLDKFWNLWIKDYLNFIRERNDKEHRNRRGAIKRHPEVDEMVLVFEPDTARGLWKVAKVKELLVSSDNEIRSVKIEYKDGFTTKRSINHLYPIEEDILCHESDTDPGLNNNNINLHITSNMNKISNNSPHSSTDKLLSFSTSFPSSKTAENYSLIMSSNKCIPIDDGLIPISSDELPSSDSGTSDTEAEKGRKEIRETRKAERILRKELKTLKQFIRELIDKSKMMVEDLEDRIGKGHPAGDLAIELQQLNEQIIGSIKNRDKLLMELAEVRTEMKDARDAFINRRK